MASGDQINMTLVTATWSQSPGPGRGAIIGTVQALISSLRMCATQLGSWQTPSPPGAARGGEWSEAARVGLPTPKIDERPAQALKRCRRSGRVLSVEACCLS